MEKKDLDQLKRKIAVLPEKEKKLRDVYLSQFAKGEIQGPIVGYPSIDKLWQKHHSATALLSSVPKQTIYEFLYENNKDHLNEFAIKYYGKQITYQELFQNIDACAKALIASGIKKGDVIGICAPTTPESIYLFYAINRIGAVSNLIDIRKSSADIEYCLNIANTKALFVYDGQIDRINQIIDKTTVKEIIALSPTISLETYKQFLADPKQYIKNKKEKEKPRSYRFYEEFISSGKKIAKLPPIEYQEEQLSLIEYTSGTTGFPKAVGLCNETANSKVHQYMNNGMIYNRGDIYLDIIPIFLAFGAIVGIHLPLSMGLTDDLIPAFDYKKIDKIMHQHPAQHMTLTPASYIGLIHGKGISKQDFKDKRTWGCGGDGMNATTEMVVNQKLHEQYSCQKVANGYGASEIGAPFSTEKEGVTEPGSVGIPLPGNNVVILKHGTQEELGYNEVGDICMIVETPMLQYLNQPELTKKAKLKLVDGTVGVMLNDAGYIDLEGNLFVKGRWDDVIQSKQGQLIWPVDVENAAVKTNQVKICAAVPVESEDTDCYLNVVLDKKSNPEIFKEKFEHHLVLGNIENLKYNIEILKEMPLTSSGKIDRGLLKKQAYQKIKR